MKSLSLRATLLFAAARENLRTRALARQVSKQLDFVNLPRIRIKILVPYRIYQVPFQLVFDH